MAFREAYDLAFAPKSINPSFANAEGMKLEDEANCKTDPLAGTITWAVEGISNSCKNKGVANVVSEKQMLHQVCSVKHWKPPVYEWYPEAGPSHRMMFTCKVMVEVEVEGAESSTTLECYSNPMYNKKAAAEHASSGAIWCLSQLGCLPVGPNANKSKSTGNNKKLKIDGEYMS